MTDKQDNYGVKPFPDDWLTRFDETTLERLAIMTVDGGLSAEEAIKRLELEDKYSHQTQQNGQF